MPKTPKWKRAAQHLTEVLNGITTTKGKIHLECSFNSDPNEHIAYLRGSKSDVGFSAPYIIMYLLQNGVPQKDHVSWIEYSKSDDSTLAINVDKLLNTLKENGLKFDEMQVVDNEIKAVGQNTKNTAEGNLQEGAKSGRGESR